jgi:glycine cleavage system H protein
MTDLPDDRRYTSEHEWAREQDGRVTVGITDYAQDQLGDVVFVDLPEMGSDVQAGQPLGEVESTKSVADVFSPISGKVVGVNEAVESSPELINSDPYGDGWLVVIEPSESGSVESLMSSEEYGRHLESEGGG